MRPEQMRKKKRHIYGASVIQREVYQAEHLEQAVSSKRALKTLKEIQLQCKIKVFLSIKIFLMLKFNRLIRGDVSC